MISVLVHFGLIYVIGALYMSVFVRHYEMDDDEEVYQVLVLKWPLLIVALLLVLVFVVPAAYVMRVYYKCIGE